MIKFTTHPVTIFHGLDPKSHFREIVSREPGTRNEVHLRMIVGDLFSRLGLHHLYTGKFRYQELVVYDFAQDGIERDSTRDFLYTRGEKKERPVGWDDGRVVEAIPGRQSGLYSINFQPCIAVWGRSLQSDGTVCALALHHIYRKPNDLQETLDQLITKTPGGGRIEIFLSGGTNASCKTQEDVLVLLQSFKEKYALSHNVCIVENHMNLCQKAQDVWHSCFGGPLLSAFPSDEIVSCYDLLVGPKISGTPSSLILFAGFDNQHVPLQVLDVDLCEEAKRTVMQANLCLLPAINAPKIPPF